MKRDIRIGGWAVFAGVLFLLSGAVYGGEAPWWAAGAAWHYRTPLDVEVRYWERKGQAYDVVVDFPNLLKAAGIEGEVGPNSVRVVRHSEGKAEVLPADFGEIYNSVKKAAERTVVFPVSEPAYGVGDYYLYFDTAKKKSGPKYESVKNLVPDWNFSAEAGKLPAGWESAHPQFFRPGEFPREAGGGECLEFFIDKSNVKHFSESTEKVAKGHWGVTEAVKRFGMVSVCRWIDAKKYTGQEIFFQVKFLATHAPCGQPAQARLRQFRGEKELRQFALDARWFTINLAEGQVVTFSDYGRISEGVERLLLEVIFRGGVIGFPEWMPPDNDLDTPIAESDYYANLCIGGMVLKPAGRINFPGKTCAEFVPGRFGGKNDRALDLTKHRAIQFGVWPFGSQGEPHCFARTLEDPFIDRDELLPDSLHPRRPSYRGAPDPTILHWPVDLTKTGQRENLGGPSTGTLEFDLKPHWDSSDNARHDIFGGPPIWGRNFPAFTLTKLGKDGDKRLGLEKGNNRLVFDYFDWDQKHRTLAAETNLKKDQWHSLAVTWDSTKGEMAMYVDGKRAAELKDAPFDWYLPEVGPMSLGGGGRAALEGAIDNVRVSDVVRYAGDYAPAQEPFRVDDHTRSLFPFDGLRHGVHHGDDERTDVSTMMEETPRREDVTLEEFKGSAVSPRSVVLNPVSPTPAQKFPSEYKDRTAFGVPRPMKGTPGELKRFEKVLAAGEDIYTIEVGGKHDPANMSVAVESLEGALVNPRVINTALPDSFNLVTTGKGLRRKEGESEEAAALRVITYYTWNNLCSAGGAPSEKHIQFPDYVPYNEINVGIRGDCGPINTGAAVLALRSGISSIWVRDCWHHHSHEVYYDGAWHFFDTSDKAWPSLGRDNLEIASLKEVNDDPYIRTKSMAGWYHGLLGSLGIPRKCRETLPQFTVPAGSRYVRLWHRMGETDPRAPVNIGANGILEIRSSPKLKDKEILSYLEEVGVRSPFPFASATVKAGKDVRLKFSDYKKEKWEKVEVRANAPASLPVNGLCAYFLKAEGGAELGDFALESVFWHNPRSINADLKLGKNEMRLKYDGKRAGPVKVTHEYHEMQ